jgi:uncharacterized protein YdhG (YjbR/CyaY superfamily)
MKTREKFNTVEEYLSAFPPATRRLLNEMREIVRKAAPGAEELISYNMPAIRQHGVLVYYAAFKEHIGFYPTASGIQAFQKELSAYEYSKGAVRFPLDKPLPVTLVKKIVQFRVKDDKLRAALKKTKLS